MNENIAQETTSTTINIDLSALRADRTAAVEKLFTNCFGELLDGANETLSLAAWQAQDIVQGLALRLSEYDGALAQEDFLNRALSVIEPAARLAVLMTLCRKAVYEGFWSILRECTDLMDDETIRPRIRRVDVGFREYGLDTHPRRCEHQHAIAREGVLERPYLQNAKAER